MELEPGTKIDGRYTVEGILGEGGIATVYRVNQNQLDRKCALKLLNTSSGSVRERLMQEGKVMATLQHPNVVNVIDVVDVDGDPGLVMEYIPGETLRHLLNDRRLALAEALGLMRGITRGVAAAHAHGLVHRDLKPENILIQTTREGRVPKVTDFGLTKVLDSAHDEAGLESTPGLLLGTPAYMAPEQIADSSDVDLRADIFSLGAILYEMVTGRRCFQGNTKNEIFESIQAGEYIGPRSLAKDLPDGPYNAIVGALHIDPEQRTPNCEYLLTLLEGHSPEEEATVLRDKAAIAGAIDSADQTLVQKSLSSLDGRKLTPAPAPPRQATHPALWAAAGFGAAAAMGLVGYLVMGT